MNDYKKSIEELLASGDVEGVDRFKVVLDEERSQVRVRYSGSAAQGPLFLTLNSNPNLHSVRPRGCSLLVYKVNIP